MHEAMGRKRLLEPMKKPKSSKKQKNESRTDDAEHPGGNIPFGLSRPGLESHF